MTELEQLIAWLDRVKVPYVVAPAGFAGAVTTVALGTDFCDTEWSTGQRSAESWFGDEARFVPGSVTVDGYPGFRHNFEFDGDGNLVISSTWE